MKKIFFILILCLVSIISVTAQNNNQTFYGYSTSCLVYNRTTHMWDQLKNGYGVRVAITGDSLFIDSKEMQAFRIYNTSELEINQSGHEQYTASASDQDGIICKLRIVYRNDGGCEAPLQFYFHYSNIDYAYNIILYKE